MRLLIVSFIAALLFSCVKSPRRHGPIKDSLYYSEDHRPQFHFSPPTQWMNDPNGLVYYEGEYHLFYQYNPYGPTWGHMSWGHAVSKDLLYWEHLPIALEEYTDPATGDSTMIFSGTVVVDKNNSSGLCDGKDCLVAIYTSNVHKNNEGIVQHQSLAYSNDNGRTWERYSKNPILSIQRKDFRDPKVFWYEPQQRWIMALVIPDLYKVRFYKSTNLLDWTQASEFGRIGDTTRIWECPDLYALPVENHPGKSKWVLSLSGGHPQGSAFAGMQYFVGEFDGTTFTPDDPKQLPLYVDYGKDFYAGIVFNSLPKEDSRTIMIGWVNNWTYGNQLPTAPWRGAMSIPRELSLKETDGGIRLIQRPIQTIHLLRGNEIIDLSENWNNELEVGIEFDPTNSSEAGIKILKNENEETLVGYNTKTQEVFIDRTHASDAGVPKDFNSIERVSVKPVDGKIKFHLFIDQSIVEVFVNDGEKVLTEQVFPKHKKSGLLTYSDNGRTTFTVLAWRMRSIWR